MLGVKRCESSIMGLVKVNQDGHAFAFGELAAAHLLDRPAVEQHLCPGGSQGQPKIIDTAKQLEETHRRAPLSPDWFQRKG